MEFVRMETVFALDVEYVKNTSAKTPEHFERLILERADILKVRFDGFVMPWDGRHTTIKISNADNGISTTTNIHRFLSAKNPCHWIKKGNETFYKSEAMRRLAKVGMSFVGWDGEFTPSNSLNAYVRARCSKHGTIHRYSLRTIMRNGHKTFSKCHECASIHKAISEHGSLKSALEYRRTRAAEFVNASGYEFVCITGEILFDHKTTVHVRCPAHNVEFSRNLGDVLYKGEFYCPECIAAAKSERNGCVHATVHGIHKPCYLYIQRLNDDYIKFGISVRPKVRMYEQRKRGSKFEHTLTHTFKFDKGWKAADLESGIKETIRGRRVNKADLPDGWTETRPISKLPEILKFIDDYIKLNTDTPIYITL